MADGLRPAEAGASVAGTSGRAIGERRCERCLGGVDDDIDLSFAARCLRLQGFAFAGRYLGGPCYRFVPLTRREAGALADEGLAILSVYSGANTVAAFRCGTQSPFHGVADAVDAALLARNVGQPRRSAIYLDLEASQTSPVPAWLGYVAGWAETLRALGYVPGVYSSPSQLDLLYAQPWAGCRLRYWVARSTGTGVLRPPPCPSVEREYADLWQYLLCTSLCGSTDIDVDSAESDEGMWRPEREGCGAEARPEPLGSPGRPQTVGR